jgi:amidase
LEIFRAARAIIVDNTDFTAAEEFKNSKVPGDVLNADFVVNLKSYLDLLTENPNKITSLDVLRHFTQTYPLEGYPTRNTGIWDKALSNWNNTDPRFWAAYQQNLYYGGEGGLLGAIERNQLEALILPTRFGHNQAAVLGSPVITVPLGSYPADTPVVKNDWGLV